VAEQVSTLPPPSKLTARRFRRVRHVGRNENNLGTYRAGSAVLPALLEPAAPLDLVLPRARRNVRNVELFYDSIAEEFDRIMNRYDLQRRLETVFDTLLGRYDLTGRTVLDAGCGTGWFSLWAYRRGADVTAVDIGPRLLAQVRRKCPARTVVGDVLDLQFEDGSFDAVISSECIEHTCDPPRAVREIIRVCRPGGLAVITSNNRTWWWLCALANRLHLRPYEGLENWPTWGELRRWMEEAGTRIVEMRGIHLFPFQVALLHPVLRFLDRFGRRLGPWCVNQAVLAIKN
jgi:ubiquinone/menaquinone biosynthesis C-methylase UbiE